MSCSVPCAGDVCIRATLWDTTGAFAHVSSGALWILFCVLLLRRWVHPCRVMVFAWAFGLAYVFAKEFWYDEQYESSDERGSGWVDAGQYIGGFVFGSLLSVTQFPSCIHRDHGYNRV